jgi:hypothetical protein
LVESRRIFWAPRKNSHTLEVRRFSSTGPRGGFGARKTKKEEDERGARRDNENEGTSKERRKERRGSGEAQRRMKEHRKKEGRSQERQRGE